MRYRRLACLLLIGMVMAGCGNKGPLYLPDDTETRASWVALGD
jgi:predicted small lipoprotein YifL